MAMIKADAYGHGLLPIARALQSADGLAVARLQEALQLRSAGVTQRILLVGTLLDEEDLMRCSEQNIDVTAHDRASILAITEHVKRAALRVWLKLDTGMHRLGLDPQTFIEADQLLSTHPGVVELVHMTHLAAAEDMKVSERQLQRLRICVSKASGAKLSIANSAALLADPDMHAEWVRPGIALYGINPLARDAHVPLRVAMTLRSCVIAIREIEAGEAVGYGGRWIARRASRIATIGIGYGDGYPRSARDGTPVLVNRRIAPLVGRVSMDSLTIDITDLSPVHVGDEVVLWGQELSPTIVAEHANTIPYELFTRLTARALREYFDEA